MSYKKDDINKDFEETALKQLASKINMDENKMNFLSEENDENKIISIIKLSDGFPCLNISEKRWEAYHPDENVRSQYCSSYNGKSTDDRYEKFDKFQTTKVKLYEDNDLSDYITDYLKYDYRPINLYGSYFIGCNIGEEGFDYDDLLYNQDLNNTCSKVMFIVTCVMGGIIMLPIFIIIGMCCNTDSSTNSYKELDCEFPLLPLIMGIGIVICLLINFILSIIILASANIIKSILPNPNNSTIDDEITNEEIRKILDINSLNLPYSLLNIISSVIFICFLITTIILFIKKRKDKNS